MMQVNEKVTMNIIQELGEVGTVGRSPVLLRLISWNHAAPKLDLRVWYNDGRIPGKGLTLTVDEARTLADCLSEFIGNPEY